MCKCNITYQVCPKITKQKIEVSYDLFRHNLEKGVLIITKNKNKPSTKFGPSIAAKTFDRMERISL